MENVERIDKLNKAKLLLDEVLLNSREFSKGESGTWFNFLCHALGFINNSISKLEKV